MSEFPVEDDHMEEDQPAVDLDRERQLRTQLLNQKRERELRAQLLQEKAEREERDRLTRREQELRAELLRRLALRQAPQQAAVNPPVTADDVMEEDQPPTGNTDGLVAQQQQFVGANPVPQPAPTSWAQLPDVIYQTLNPQDFSYQLTSDNQFFWHPAEPGILIRRGTFEMFHITNGAIGFYKNAHFIKHDHDIEYGSEFWLKPKSGKPVYDVNSYVAGGPDDDLPRGYIYVPWEHIVEHLYGYTTMGDKESHSFFPPGTTEAALLQYLVDALNSGQGKVPVGGVDAGIAWEERGRVIKTFFRWLQDGHPDKYTAEETVFVKDNF
jgi:hypothetical protein